MAEPTADRDCVTCGKTLRGRDADRSECHSCRSPVGKVEQLDVAIRASGDDPERIRDWPAIRHLLRERFGEQPSDVQLWERCTDWLAAEGKLTKNVYFPFSLSKLQRLLKNGFPNGPLQQASEVFYLAGKLAFAFSSQRDSGAEVITLSNWPAHSELFGDFDSEIKRLADVIRNPPAGFEAVAAQLREAGNTAKRIKGVAKKPSTWSYHDFTPELNSICRAGSEAVHAAQVHTEEDEYGFLDPPSTEPESADDELSDSISNGAEASEPEFDPLNDPSKVSISVSRHFHPSHVTESNLWRRTLERLQSQFTANSNGPVLTGLLEQSIIPEWPRKNSDPSPPAIDGKAHIAFGPSLHRHPEQLFTEVGDEQQRLLTGVGRRIQEDWRLKILDLNQYVHIGKKTFAPAIGDSTAFNIDGNPILYSNGQAVAMQLGVNGQYRIYVENSKRDAGIEAEEIFTSLAKQAGSCLTGLPPQISQQLWRDWPDGFHMISEKGLWICAMFELAWQKVAGSPLAANRHVWWGAVNAPIDTIHLLRQREPCDEWLNNIPDPPTHWYSILDDLFIASVAAIDILLMLATTLDSGGDQGSRAKKPGNNVTQTKKRTGRRTSEELFKAALRAHHNYGSKSVEFNFEPATTRRIEELTEKGISDTTAGRYFRSTFGSIQKYKVACRDGTIEQKLILVMGEGLQALGTIDPRVIEQSQADDEVDSF